MQISGTAAVVTGGASGLGEATARALAAKGARVAIFDRDADKGEKVAAEIGGVFCEVDVTSDEKVAAAFEKARAAQPGRQPRLEAGVLERRLIHLVGHFAQPIEVDRAVDTVKIGSLQRELLQQELDHALRAVVRHLQPYGVAEVALRVPLT